MPARRVAVVDHWATCAYGGNAVLRGGRRRGGHDVVITSDRTGARAERVVLPFGQGHGRLHVRTARVRAAWTRCEAARSKPCGRASACRCCWTTARKVGDDGRVPQGWADPGSGPLSPQRPGVSRTDGSRYKVPHMGWNQVWRTPRLPTLTRWERRSRRQHFYFVHSYLRPTVRCTPQRRRDRLRRPLYGRHRPR